MTISTSCAATLLVIAASATVAGCGSPAPTSPKASSSAADASASGPTATAAPTAPCSLVSQADAETAAGQPLGRPQEDLTLGTCTYASFDFAASVTFTFGTWDAIKTAAQGGAGARAPIAVDGVGDEALSRGGSYLAVRKGRRGVLLVINGPHVDGLPDHGLSRVEDLARTILPKL